MPARIRTIRHRHAAFSLTELMIAIGIFAIGAIAVASIFPVAIMLQKATVESVNSRAFADNAKAIAITRGFSKADLLAAVTAPTPDIAVGEVFTCRDAVEDIRLLDRSYNSSLGTDNRRVYWTALFMPTDLTTGTEQFQVFVFVMRRADNATYDKSAGTDTDWASDRWDEIVPTTPDTKVPGVTWINPTSATGNTIAFDNDPKLIRIGDKILDDAGRDWRVTASTTTGIDVDGTIPATGINFIWFVHPGDSGRTAYVRLIKDLISTEYPTLLSP